MEFKTQAEIDVMREGGEILSRLLGELSSQVVPGCTTLALDAMAEEFVRDHGAVPSFKGYKGFPFSICASVNQVAVHGLPSATPLQEGDIVTLDGGVYYKGYHTDAAFSYAVGIVPEHLLNLLAQTEAALCAGIRQLRAGNKLGDVGSAIEAVIQEAGFGVVRAYGGHGIGKRLHEAPFIPNFGKPGEGKRLRDGMVVAIEPITLLEGEEVVVNGQGEVVSSSGVAAAHFEHTAAIVEGEPFLLTSYKYIKK